MTDQQPTTLRLADLLTDPDGRFYDFDIRIAADELRRLHAVSTELFATAYEWQQKAKKLESINAQLLDALERAMADLADYAPMYDWHDDAIAAIAAASDETSR